MTTPQVHHGAPRAARIRPGLLMLLAAVVAAGLFFAFTGEPPATDAAEVAVAVRHGSKPDEATATRQRLRALNRGLAAWSQRAAFVPLSDAGRRAWESRAPNPALASVADAAAVPPAAPAFPYEWVGRWDEPSADGGAPSQRIVIAGPRSTWVLKPGDVIERQWRIDAIGPGTVQLTYLPLSQPQTISMTPP